MFFSVIAAYVLAAVFAFCGIVNVVTCISNAEQEMGYPLFLNTLTIAMWPLVVAIVLVLLVQIGCLVEKLPLLNAMKSIDAGDEKSTPAAPPAAPAARPVREAAAPTPVPTPAAAPAGTAQPAPLYSNTPEMSAVTPPMMTDEPAAPLAEEKPQESVPQQPAAPQQSGLSFFKLD